LFGNFLCDINLQNMWAYITGIILVGVGIRYVKCQVIGVGFEGRPDFIHITGGAAVLIGFGIIFLGLLILLKPNVIGLLIFPI